MKVLFVIINILGGIAVLGSYGYGFSAYPESVEALWGEVPQHLLGLYTINMVLAAAGYLLVFAYALLKVPANTRTSSGGLLFERLNALYFLILFCSALWMPLSFALLDAPNADLWWSIRAVLFGTGFSALLVGYELYRHAPERGTFLTLALCGYVFFCFQTAVLDALVWPWFFPI